MRPWRVVALMNLALIAGVTLGYVRWGQEARALRQQVLRLERRWAAVGSGAGEWSTRGVVRLVLADPPRIVLTHESIPGLMDGMTMGFDVEDPRLLAGLETGDVVRFTLRSGAGRLRVVALDRASSP